MFAPSSSRPYPTPFRPPAQILHQLLRLALYLVFVTASLTGWATPAWAQLPPQGAQPVTAINFTIETAAAAGPTLTDFANPCDTAPIAGDVSSNSFSGCAAQKTNLSYQGQNKRLTTFLAGGREYERVVPPGESVVFQRAGAGLQNRDILFFEGGRRINPVTPGVAIDLVPSLVPNAQRLEDVLLSSIINRGIDNVFANQFAAPTGQDTLNNVQRIDYIVPGGIDVPVAERDNQGFIVLERGGNDNFRIAAITAFDPGTGLPTAYGPLLAQGPGNWGVSGDPALNFVTTVNRREPPGAGPFLPSHVVNAQSLAGIFFPVNSLVSNIQGPIFGYSLFANDAALGADPLNPGLNLLDFGNFPTTTTNANDSGGLDLVAGGFGLFRIAQPQLPSFALLKRITNLFGVAPLPNFNQVVGDGTALALLQANGLGQGLDVITDPQVQPGNGIEYTVYFANSGAGATDNVVLCDQIPAGLTFDPSGYGGGAGIQFIPSSSPPAAAVTLTNADDGDAGRFIAPGAALPPFCGVNRGNGAVVVNVGTVSARQVGLIRFRTGVN